jgi:hypothetical protein
LQFIQSVQIYSDGQLLDSLLFYQYQHLYFAGRQLVCWNAAQLQVQSIDVHELFSYSGADMLLLKTIILK